MRQEYPVDDVVDLDDMDYDEGSKHTSPLLRSYVVTRYSPDLDTQLYSWACRCSGNFEISETELEEGFDVITCSLCTLSVRVSYTVVNDDSGS